MPSFLDRLQHAWNAFRGRDHPGYVDTGPGYGSRPDRVYMRYSVDKTIMTAICNRIAIDVASIAMRHVRLDENGRFSETLDTGLNYALTQEANIDQTARAFTQDVVMSMLDEGVVAVVPVDTTDDPEITGAFDIKTMRAGKIVQWFPEHVRVQLYNDRTGLKEEVTLPKKMVAIIENPLYAVMNEKNSVLQRLIRKLALLDVVDEQSSSGKLRLIIQLPYTVRTEARQKEAEKRRLQLEDQLTNSKYGVAYSDATEKITQLNGGIENNLMTQIEYLTKMLYSQLGITEEVFNGTATEEAMLNYNNRTIEPIISAIVNEYSRKFLTRWARSRREAIMFFREPFRLVPVNNLAEIADKFTRNEILTSNEVRGLIGFMPANDPNADELRNKNLSEGADVAKAKAEALASEADHDSSAGGSADMDL